MTFVAQSVPAETMMRTALTLIPALLLFATHLPAQQPVTTDPQACPGSTVDLQGAEFAQKSRAFLASLQAAVKSGDQAAVADMASYPLTVIHGSMRTRIKSKALLISQYDSVFDGRIRRAIEQQTAKCLFGNDQGAMVGNGEVWFAEQPGGAMKIISINARTGK